MAPVADAVDVPAAPRRAPRVERRQLRRVRLRRGEHGADFPPRARDGNGRAAEGGEPEAVQRRFAGGCFGGVGEVGGGRGGGRFHVVVVEALEDVEGGVGGYVGNDVDGSSVGWGGCGGGGGGGGG